VIDANQAAGNGYPAAPQVQHSVTVSRAKPSVDITISPSGSTRKGHKVSMTFKIIGGSGVPEPTGVVNVTVNGNPIAGCQALELEPGTTLRAATAKCVTHHLPRGNDHIKVSYLGDGDYTTTHGSTTYTIHRA
jgi:hypothetical protein